MSDIYNTLVGIGRSSPKQIGPYKIVDEIARGGAGVVYRALDPRLGREVAIKLLLASSQASEHQRERFRREVEALGRLKHKHLVPVHEAGEHEGAPYIVMAFMQGGSLQDRLDAQGPLSPRVAANLVWQLAGALAYCHAQGILHRDLKPHNVLMDERGDPLLTDFGLAALVDEEVGNQPSAEEMASRMMTGSGRLSITGQFLGTPGYWSPEQASGELWAVGATSDVYGLGALLYALLTGCAPVVGDTLFEIMASMQEPITPPSSLQPTVDSSLEAICLGCLHTLPLDRYPSAHALAEDLDRYLRGQPPLGAKGDHGTPSPPVINVTPRPAPPSPRALIQRRYAVMHKLGLRAHGTAFAAIDNQAGRPVTLLYVEGADVSDDELQAACEQAQAAQAPGLRLLGWARDANGQRPILVHEPIGGESVHTTLARLGRLPLRDALWVGEQTLLQLGALHEAGSVHGAVRPDTVFVAGAALRLMPRDAHLKGFRRKPPFARLAYLPPELLDDATQATAPGDLYALAVLVYELISGELPVRGTDGLTQIVDIRDFLLVPLRERVPSVPARVEAVLDVALAPHAGERYPNAQAFLRAIQGLADCV